MVDLAPDLLEAITNDFNRICSSDKNVQSYLKRLDDGEATQRETSLFARTLGEHASDALINNITEEVLPDGKLYWNIADKTIMPFLKYVHATICEAAVRMQEIEDKKAGINIKAIIPDFPEKRIKDIINKAVIESLNGDIDES